MYSPWLCVTALARVLDFDVIYKLGSFHLDCPLYWELQGEGFLENQKERLVIMWW